MDFLDLAAVSLSATVAVAVSPKSLRLPPLEFDLDVPVRSPLPVRAVVDASSVLPPRRHRERLHLQRHRRLAHRLSLIGG